MVRLFKKEVTDKKLSYYYRETPDGENGIITYYFETDEWVVEKYCDELEKNYPYLAIHAKYKMEEYINNKNFPDKDVVMWY